MKTLKHMFSLAKASTSELVSEKTKLEYITYGLVIVKSEKHKFAFKEIMNNFERTLVSPKKNKPTFT